MNSEYKSFEYHFKDQRLYEDYFALYSIGKEYWEDEVYSFDCRNVSQKQCIFQYTVSGEGRIVIGRQNYTLRAGQAFLIEKPGPYFYYLPKESDHWEIIFIALNLSSITIWRDLTDKYGHVVDIPTDSGVLKYWEFLYSLALENKVDNFFLSSAYAYTFMMHLNDTLHKSYEARRASNAVQNCVNIIHGNYQDNLTLSYLADLCSVSASQLSSKFKLTYKLSPIQYLIKYRIEVACTLLLRSNEKIEDIAKKVGIGDPNYFSRVFKQHIGITPREYRIQEYTRLECGMGNAHWSLSKAPKKSGSQEVTMEEDKK